MKTKDAILFLTGLLIGATLSVFFAPQFTGFTTGPGTNPENISVFFCPTDPCAEELIFRINSAQSSVDIAIYSFTLDEISDALIDAKQRGVKVRVLFDEGESKSQYSEDEKLAANQISIKRFEKTRGLMHNKFAIIDQHTVITGSYNYSQNATQYNNENLIAIKNTRIASQYQTAFEFLWNQS